MFSFTCSKYWGPKNLKMGYATLTNPLWGGLLPKADMDYMCIKLEDSSLSRSRDVKLGTKRNNRGIWSGHGQSPKVIDDVTILRLPICLSVEPMHLSSTFEI